MGKTRAELFQKRSRYDFGWIEASVMLLYAAILAIAVSHHEPCTDQAQAWLIARDSRLTDLLLHRLHYEGAPALWHLLLMPLSRLHLPISAGNWLASILGIAGVYVLLRFSPFPALIRYLLPFTFYLQYQYAIIARSYVLVPVLIFSACAVMLSKRERPLLFAILAGLLANTSLYGACLSAGIVAIYIWNRLRPGNTTATQLLPRRSWSLAAGILLLFWLCSAAVAFPAPDGSFGGKIAKSIGRVFTHGQNYPQFPAISPWNTPFHQGPVEMAEPASATGFRDTIWKITHQHTAGDRKHFLEGKILERGLWVLSLVTYPISNSNLLAMAFWLLLLIRLVRQKALIVLLPYVLVMLLGVAIELTSHHTGMLWMALLAAAWITWDRPPVKGEFGTLETTGFSSILLAVVLLQIVWTVHAVRADARGNYAPGKETALFLKQNAAGKTIAGFTPMSNNVQPYFAHNIYFNQESAYWPWRIGHDADEQEAETLARHPDFVIFGIASIGNANYPNQWTPMQKIGISDESPSFMSALASFHYRETHRFCGRLFIQMGYAYEDCLVVMQPMTQTVTSRSNNISR